MDPETGAYLYYNEVTEEYSAELDGVKGAHFPGFLPSKWRR